MAIFRLKKPDIRQYSHARSFGTTQAVPPEGLRRVPYAVYNQIDSAGVDSDFCTGYSLAGALSFKLGFAVSPEFLVAKEGEVTGQPILNGTDMDTAPKAVVAFGVIPQKDCPLTLQADGARKVSSYLSYPTALDAEAAKNAQGAYYTAHDGSLDAFGNIVSAIYQAHLSGEEIAVQVGTPWYAEFNAAAYDNKVMPMPSTEVSEHAWVIFDWRGDTALALLSNGMGFGNNGVLEFPREVVNFLFQDPFATSRVMRDKDITDGSYRGIILKYLLDTSYQLLNLLYKLKAQS